MSQSGTTAAASAMVTPSACADALVMAPILVIACGAIAHELVAVTRASEFGSIDIQCLPAEWHNRPERIAPAVERKIQQAQGRYAQIMVAYGDCGTGGELDRVLSRYGISRLPGDHCYSFFAGRQVFEDMAEQALGTFYLTDYLVDHFERLIMVGLGIRRHPALRDQYFEHYTRVMYLAQDPTRKDRLNMAASAANALGLSLHVHETGLQPFEHALGSIRIAAI
ncbi:MAG: DUF1638 domain-containing protein [Granulosicoccus sp.]|nr:DUF1638 domain-containing protein [Granulosicoccus sp.]